MCDDNGILLGVNKHNNSLIIVDIFADINKKEKSLAFLRRVCYYNKAVWERQDMRP